MARVRQVFRCGLAIALAVVFTGLVVQASLAHEEEAVVQRFDDPGTTVSSRLPAAATPLANTGLIVHVRDDKGQPVDGVMVEFQLTPAQAGQLSVSPQRAVTHNGAVRATVHQNDGTATMAPAQR